MIGKVVVGQVANYLWALIIVRKLDLKFKAVNLDGALLALVVGSASAAHEFEPDESIRLLR